MVHKRQHRANKITQHSPKLDLFTESTSASAAGTNLAHIVVGSITITPAARLSEKPRPSQTMAVPRYIFLASIGNPAPYTNTLHSAGHIVLSDLATHLGLPQFATHAPIRPGISTSRPDQTLTLWQSPSLMNVSGRPLSQAWRRYLSLLSPEDRTEARLYVIHDELEAGLGKVKIRHTGSAKGHNGLKSIITSLGGKMDAFSRVGVGIGRPKSRDAKDVSQYVIRKCRPTELIAFKTAAEEVARLLELG